MTRFGLALAALFAAFAAQAQTTPPSGAADGKSSIREQQRQKARAARRKAVEICKSAQPDKHRDCMRHELCAHARNPVQCEARAKQRAEGRKAPRPSS